MVFKSIAVLCGAVALSWQCASGKLVTFNDAIASPIAQNAVSFLADARNGMRMTELMASAASAAGHEECSITETRQANAEVTVLLAISKCLDDDDLNTVKDWVKSLQDEELVMYFEEGQSTKIRFEATMIPGACQQLSERTQKGLKESGVSLLSTEVQATDLRRLASLAPYARVLEAPPAGKKEDVPVAVISFTNDEKSFTEVKQYERTFNVDKCFDFRICKEGKNCEGHFENCVKLIEAADVFMYNPFTVTREFHCAKLKGGLPITYIDNYDNRKCFCHCPVGFVEEVDGYGNKHCAKEDPKVCECEWAKRIFGYTYEVTSKLEKCEFSHISKWVAVPFPSDNYVSDHRVNDKDSSYRIADGPHVALSTRPIRTPVMKWKRIENAVEGITHNTLPTTWKELVSGYVDDLPQDLGEETFGEQSMNNYTWMDYQKNRVSKVDALTYESFGKYKLKLAANDYSDDVECPGCISIIDKFRPKATVECPTSFCDKTVSSCKDYVAELTEENQRKASSNVKDVYDFRSKAVNDACSVDSYGNQDRCDHTDVQIRDFFSSEYKQIDWANGKKCFKKEEILKDFFKGSKATTNPLVTTSKYEQVVKQDDKPVSDGQCTRCCKYHVELRETWVDYKCGHDYAVSYCDGDADQKCSMSQCLTMHGDTFATVGAHIRKPIAKESQKVLDRIVQKGFQTHTQIHRALQCSKFGAAYDGDCKYDATISSLIETKAETPYGMGDIGDVNKFVFWRYKVGAGEWKLFSGEEKHSFNEPETKITVQAWTQCGMAREFFFYVHLHVNSAINVCDYFNAMWYQSSVSLKRDGALCAYPMSDFAEITFDYRPNAGLQYARNNIRMNATNVVCYMSIAGRPRAEILRVERKSPEIVKRYAIELVNKATTKPQTAVKVECDFTYTLHDETTKTQTCGEEFEVIDCNGPKIDCPDGECRFDACAGNALPGPYEACGGNVVRSTPYATTVDTSKHECCQSCYSETKCVPILDMPLGKDDIYQCVPPTPSEGSPEVSPETPEQTPEPEVSPETPEQTPEPEVDSESSEEVPQPGNPYGPGPEEEPQPANPYGPPVDAYGTGPEDEGAVENAYGPAPDAEPSLLMAKVKSIVASSQEHVSLLAAMSGTALVALVALVAVKRRHNGASNQVVEEDAYYPLLH